MKLIHYIYSLLFFLAISKQALAMENEETSEIARLGALLTKNKSINDFKTNILENENNRKEVLRILSRPYSQARFNSSFLSVDWNIGNMCYDSSKGYHFNLMGGVQQNMEEAVNRPGHRGAKLNMRFFKDQRLEDKIENFFDTINLKNIDKKNFFNIFSKENTLEFYRNTYFFHYLLEYCTTDENSTVSQEEMWTIEKHLQKEIILQATIKILLLCGSYLSYKTLAHIINNYTEPFFDNLKNKKALNMLVHQIDPLKEKVKSDFFEKVFLPKKLKIFLRDFKTIYENPLTKEHKHLIFFGPPGTAKTMIAVKFATEELKKKSIMVNAGMLTSLKNPSGALKNIFEQKNAIIIFDEIESLLSLESLKHELLTCLQNGSGNKSPLVFATTNIPNIKDKFPSLCRPGRFNPVLVDALQNESDIKLFTHMILKEYNISLNKEAQEYLLTTLRNEKDITGAKIKNILLCAKELTNEINIIKQSSLNKIMMKIKTLLRKKESESPLLLTKESLIKALNFYSMNLQ